MQSTDKASEDKSFLRHLFKHCVLMNYVTKKKRVSLAILFSCTDIKTTEYLSNCLPHSVGLLCSLFIHSCKPSNMTRKTSIYIKIRYYCFYTGTPSCNYADKSFKTHNLFLGGFGQGWLANWRKTHESTSKSN